MGPCTRKSQGQCCVQNNATAKSRTDGSSEGKKIPIISAAFALTCHGGPRGKTSPPRWLSVRPLSQSMHHMLTQYTLITSSLTPLPTGSQRDSPTNKKSHYQLLHRTNFPMSLSMHINLPSEQQPT